MAKGNKTEQPTQWRLEKAKKKGDIPRSREFATSASLFVSILFLLFYSGHMGSSMLELMRKQMSFATVSDFTISTAAITCRYSFGFYLKLMAPFFTILIFLAFLITVVQGGFRIIPENLKLNWGKLNFLKGLKKIIMSAESLFELLKTLVKTVVILSIAYLSIREILPRLLPIASYPLLEMLAEMGMIFFKVSLRVVLFLFVLAVADYLWVRWRYKQRLKMSKEEVKDEYKDKEGDPQIKSKQRSIQYQKAIQRMMSQVPKADVVITNPDHYALALQYEFKQMPSPKVLAKGKDLLAEKIKSLAREHGIPVVENPPLARALYSAVEVGGFVPQGFFKPVAEILAYIYKLKGRRIS